MRFPSMRKEPTWVTACIPGGGTADSGSSGDFGVNDSRFLGVFTGIVRAKDSTGGRAADTRPLFVFFVFAANDGATG